MSVPVFDQRAAADFFSETFELAQYYTPDWGLPDDVDDVTSGAVAQDFGLVLLELFSLLGQDLASVVNAIPVQRQLALYRFLDMPLRPAVCASTPISFSLAQNVAPVTLPKGTAVTDASAQRAHFETNSDVQVLPATLSAVLTVVPRLDCYWDMQSLWQSGRSAPTFAGDVTDRVERAFSHCLMIGDGALFAPGGAASRMTMVLTGERLDPDYFRCWCDGALKPLSVNVTGRADRRTCTIEFDAMPTAAAEPIGQLHAALSAYAGHLLDMTDPFIASDCPSTPLNWLVCMPAIDRQVVPALDGYLPQVDSVWCDFGTLSTLPQQAAFNGTPIDLKLGGYAFGSTAPTLDASFSVRCDAAFSEPGVPITMHLDVRTITAVHTAEITWQYWNGIGWSALAADGDPYRFVDETNNLMTSGTVSFICPSIAPTSVAGSRGRWVRAVLSRGDYGDAKNGYDAPFVRSLTIDYESGGIPSAIWTHNAFDLKQLSAVNPEPYRPLAEEGASVYLGFKSPDLLAYGLGQRLTLYVDVDPRSEHVGYTNPGQWQWFDVVSAAWQPLDIEVGDVGLARSGTISFIVPRDMFAAVLFSQTACWFRMLCPSPDNMLRLRGIYPNTVTAANRTTYRNEVLGSSNGQPGQRFWLNQADAAASTPEQVVLAVREDPQYAVAISVLEPVAAELATLGKSQPQQQTSAYPWTRVDSLIEHGPHDRVFAVDVIAGAIVFGDGKHGRIPPPGAGNVIATCYAVTLGTGGNVGAGALTQLSASVRGIARMTNPVRARGGADADRVDDLTGSGPALVRANDRAVTAADVEALACLANAGIGQVRAIEHADGVTSLASAIFGFEPSARVPCAAPRLELVVLAASSEPEPLTPMSMLDDVLAYIRARCTPALAMHMTARRPSFRRIDVDVLLQTNAPKSQWPDLRLAIASQLTAFLHPAQGGPAGRGWPIGEVLRYHALYSFLRSCQPSVTAVTAMAVCGQASNVVLAPDEAPAAGAIDVRFAEASQS